MTVKIRLLEAHTHKPIPSTNIYLISKDLGYQTDQPTDNNGWAYFTLQDGTYIIKVRSPDHRPYTKTHNISRNSIIEIKLNQAYIY